jgi:hypothetical protein
MTQQIILNLRPEDDPMDYANPTAALLVIFKITAYLHELEKRGNSFISADEAVEKIRAEVLSLCADIGEEWIG